MARSRRSRTCRATSSLADPRMTDPGGQRGPASEPSSSPLFEPSSDRAAAASEGAPHRVIAPATSRYRRRRASGISARRSSRPDRPRLDLDGTLIPFAPTPQEARIEGAAPRSSSELAAAAERARSP